ncbi:hypothetical protein [Sphingomonas sp. R1]|uniref:hypothetical protein n=1 Tax=Sphingomonas sp. R1 TaxID=399176 RepID=UPI00222550D4|nr:hypothetical protein [Sphingomonas sp. R1]UYY77193.1 hypothetical protein OIM94_17130 [Sphingomonas sp. R1]
MDSYWIDESGYTGFDLLNYDQRFEGAAAIAIENDDAERLIKEHFSWLKTPVTPAEPALVPVGETVEDQ